MTPSLRQTQCAARPSPKAGKGECSVFLNTLILCDALEARLRSADAMRERGRLVESVLARVGENYVT